MRLTQRQLRRLIEAEIDRGRLSAPGPSRDAVIAQIARSILHIETLETRNDDSHDFHNVGVWSVKKALEAAYDAGASASSE